MWGPQGCRGDPPHILTSSKGQIYWTGSQALADGTSLANHYVNYRLAVPGTVESWLQFMGDTSEPVEPPEV